jgi:hypothetical protein
VVNVFPRKSLSTFPFSSGIFHQSGEREILIASCPATPFDAPIRIGPSQVPESYDVASFCAIQFTLFVAL